MKRDVRWEISQSLPKIIDNLVHKHDYIIFIAFNTSQIILIIVQFVQVFLDILFD